MKDVLSKPNEVLKWCLRFAIAFVLFYHFCLIDIPEIIPGGSKIGLEHVWEFLMVNCQFSAKNLAAKVVLKEG